jgi:hypothetical protein
MLVCGVFISQTVYSQEDKVEKKVRVKVITVKDGEETTLDTTFSAEDFDDAAFKKEMKEKYGIEMENLEGEEGEGVKVKVDSEKTDEVGVETHKEYKKVVVVKEIETTSEMDKDMIWEEEVEASDPSDKPRKIYIISEDGEKFTIEESGEDDKVIWITDEGEEKLIQKGEDKKVIMVTEEGETHIIKGEGGEKVIIIKTDDDKCDKAKKEKKVKEETIKVIVITDDEDDAPDPDKK